MSSLTEVDTFQCTNNEGITSLSGLDALEKITGHLYISNNPALQSLTGLSNLQELSGSMFLGSNHALQSLDGLQNCKSTEYVVWWIDNNNSLTDFCALKSIWLNSEPFGVATYIQGNAENPDRQWIMSNCP